MARRKEADLQKVAKSLDTKLRAWLDFRRGGTKGKSGDCTMQPNIWIYAKEYQLYVRDAFHACNGVITPTLDLSNIEVYADYCQQGVFTTVVETMEAVADDYRLLVYVESVLNIHVGNVCLKRGYTQQNSTDWMATGSPDRNFWRIRS